MFSWWKTIIGDLPEEPGNAVALFIYLFIFFFLLFFFIYLFIYLFILFSFFFLEIQRSSIYETSDGRFSLQSLIIIGSIFLQSIPMLHTPKTFLQVDTIKFKALGCDYNDRKND